MENECEFPVVVLSIINSSKLEKTSISILNGIYYTILIRQVKNVVTLTSLNFHIDKILNFSSKKIPTSMT